MKADTVSSSSADRRRADLQPRFDASGLGHVSRRTRRRRRLMVAHMNDGRCARRFQPGKPGTTAARARRFGRARPQVMSSALSRCGWTAIRTPSGSGRAKRRGGVPHRAALVFLSRSDEQDGSAKLSFVDAEDVRSGQGLSLDLAFRSARPAALPADPRCPEQGGRGDQQAADKAEKHRSYLRY